MKLENVCAVVTGATSGMGRAAARALVEAGAKVCIVGRSQERGEALAAELGENSFFESADVSDAKRAEEIVQKAVERFGYVNVVINCAGMGSGTRILPRGGGVFPLETFKRVLDINLIGTFNYTCYGALAMSQAPEQEDGERGVIINVTSMAVTHGQIGQAAYSASKGAVHAMTLPIARELARIGVRVNTILPGLIATNISGVEMENKGMPRREEDPYAENPFMKDYIFPRRQGSTSEFASLALEIIRNGFINGASYALDGCVRLGPK